MSRSYRKNSLGPAMSRGELIGGFFYLPVYLLALTLILSLVLDWIAPSYTDAQFNAVFYIVNFLVMAAIFHRFLIASLRALMERFWPAVQAVILGYVLYWVVDWLAAVALSLLNPSTVNPNQAAVNTLLQTDFYLFAACTVLLAPLVEELFFRGLFFSNLYPKSRILAYTVSVVCFSLLHIYNYIGVAAWRDLLFSFLAYVPPSIALAWTYERAGTIWAPILLHAFINFVNCGLLGALL